MEGEKGTPAEDANEVILESLDGLSSHVVPMVIGGNKLECLAQCANGFLVCRQYLIVQYLMSGDNSCFAHGFQGSCPCQNKFVSGFVLEGLHPCRIDVDIVENHDIPVAEARCLREKASLIGVHRGLEVVVKIMMSPLQM